jgi:hypothetical protein
VQSDVPHMTVGPDGLDLGVIPLELASSIHGTVSGYAGPIGWINVDACRDDGLCFEGLSDDNGTFSVPGIAPGSYVLSFRDWSGTFATGYYSDSGIVDYAFLATPITVPPSPAALSVTLRRSGGGVPGAPLSVVAVAGDGSADVTWAPPLDNGGYQIYQYAVTASNGEVCFSSGTECPFVDLTNGESYTFTVVASNMAGDSRPSAPSEPVTPMAPPPVPVAVRLGVSASATSVTAGGSVTLTVSALDQNSNLVPDYQGTVTLSCASGWCSLPDPYTFTMDDAGVHQFTVNLGTAGQQAIHVDDGVLQAGDAVVTVKPGPTVTLNVTGPQTTTAGVQGRFSISCTDVYGNVTTDFTGKVKLQRSDPSMAGPNSVQIVKGHGQFKATFKTAGDQWIAVSNAGATAFGMAYVHVNSAAAFRLVIGGVAARSVDGAPISLTVTAVDRFGNVATGYDGTVRFTSNDRVAGLPAGYKFTTQDSGVHAFTVILRTPGRRWVKVKDTSKHPLGDVARVLVTRT